MTAVRLTENDLRRELNDFKDRYPSLGDDELFVLWFLRAFVAEDEGTAASALCGGSRDKGVDAVLIDDSARIVFLVQGKYRQKVDGKSESRGEVLGFARLVEVLCGDSSAFADYKKGLSPEVCRRLEESYSRIRKREYTLHMLYVTLGKCSKSLLEEALRIVRSANKDGCVNYQLFDGKRIVLLLADYLDGVAPPVPSLDLEIESGGGVKTTGVLSRYDSKTDIDSYIFSMTDQAVAGLFERASTRLFARNVRGFLGSTEINRGMETTLEKEPEYFWYYNNGITIICDDAKQESSRGRNILRVTNPQIINGQQTTRTLSSVKNGTHASVLVRVIRVPRSGKNGGNGFDTLVSRIVAATNWQNAIRPSDLMSNDRRQIEIERQLRKLHYQYLRKRMTKGEARSVSGTRHLRQIKKEELAQAVAGSDLDPYILREGKERLFEERWYGQIFPSADPNFYLPRYWLMREVGNAARGYPERAYAKWLTLNFAWHNLESLCRKRAGAAVFREACERNLGELLTPLRQALNAIFVASLNFYRANRGSGPTATDVSTFFKRRGLDKEFTRFWEGKRNTSRAGFERSWNKFCEALNKAMTK